MAMVRRLAQSVVLVLVALALASCTRHSQTPRAAQATATVPQIQNRSPVEAQRLLHHEGLVLVGFRETKDSAIPKGTVVSSDPPPGKHVAAGTSVVLIVSTGAPPRRLVRRPVTKPEIPRNLPHQVIRIPLARRTTAAGSVALAPRDSSDGYVAGPTATASPVPAVRTRSHPNPKPAVVKASEKPAELKIVIKQSRPRLKCPNCGMMFETQAQLSAHEDIHVYRCTVCNSGFSSVRDLQRHAREQHFRAALKCPECGAFFYTETGLRTHMATHESGH